MRRTPSLGYKNLYAGEPAKIRRTKEQKQEDFLRHLASLAEQNLTYEEFHALDNVATKDHPEFEVRKIKWLRAIAYRAQSKKLIFDIPDNIVLPEVCPVLGVPLGFYKGALHPNSYSLDRIDPNKHYTVDNVRVMSLRANRLKSNANPKEQAALASFADTTLPGLAIPF